MSKLDVDKYDDYDDNKFRKRRNKKRDGKKRYNKGKKQSEYRKRKRGR